MGDPISATSPSSKPQTPPSPPLKVPADAPTNRETKRDSYCSSTAGDEKSEQRTMQALAKITDSNPTSTSSSATTILNPGGVNEKMIVHRNLDAALAAKDAEFKNTIR